MSKKKPTSFFFEHYSNGLIAKFINLQYPISLKYNEDLLNRVASRYPLIDKSLVALILKQFFQSWRDLLILGYTFELQKVFPFARLFFFYKPPIQGYIPYVESATKYSKKIERNQMTEPFDDEQEASYEYKPLDIEDIRANIKSYSSIKLAEMIVCDRYFGCYRDIAVLCMQQLAARRSAGDVFNFEDYIEQSFKKLPQLNQGAINIRDVISQTMGRAGKK